ncbi:MAG: DUF5103 domain-containing protein, partial [Cyclobacteriaceae bacterium]|nr:DUF5103 domain-containing protein [Cyclobacteriaceae bacterium]
QKKLEYMFFDHSNTFNPGNEFRYFDLRSIVSPGQFVLNLDRMATPYMANIIPDKPRTGLAYTYTPDYNGWYLISNRDSGNSDYYGDYVKVSFTLEANEPYNGDVYIQGALTNWKMSEENRMVYSAEQRAYQCTLLLKQGWYDYQYVIKEPTGKITNLEGNFIDTENYYEIAVYYTPPASRSDLLVGYYRFGINQRP